VHNWRRHGTKRSACTAGLTVRVRYQVAGPRMSPAEALVASGRLATLRADLEAALGPLAVFENLTKPDSPALSGFTEVNLGPASGGASLLANAMVADPSEPAVSGAWWGMAAS
jgi:hypothetical protein